MVGRLLEESGQTVAAAESLTGGEPRGAAVRRHPASSAYFKGSAVCYTAEAKRDVLGVSPGDDRRPRCGERGSALGRWPGARAASSGPISPSPSPGWPARSSTTASRSAPSVSAWPGRTARCRCSFRAPGDRDIVRRWAEQVALDLLRRHLSGLAIRSDLFPPPASPVLPRPPRDRAAPADTARSRSGCSWPWTSRGGEGRGGRRGGAVPAPDPRRPVDAIETARDGEVPRGDLAADGRRRALGDLDRGRIGARLRDPTDRGRGVPRLRRARVIWVGLEDAEGRFAALAGGLDELLADVSRPRAMPSRRTSRWPGLTRPGPFRSSPPTWWGPSVRLRALRLVRLVLYRSHLSPHGATYEPLERFPLATGRLRRTGIAARSAGMAGWLRCRHTAARSRHA